MVPGDEWDKFMAIMRQPLPSTFRITGTQHLATAVRECLQHSFFSQLTEAVKQGIGENEEGLTPPKPLPWSDYIITRLSQTTFNSHESCNIVVC